jgi:large subunit ribosomal protein L18
MESKRAKRQRRAARSRHIIREQGANRLTVYRSNNHMYAQIISPCGSKVLTQASTMDATIKGVGIRGLNTDMATKVGKLIAERAIQAGVDKVAFDRSGFRYHGRIKALADGAREGGLKF